MPIRVFSEEEKKQLKTKMLESGFPLLKQYGMTHTSVSKIAKAAEIGTSTFYNFFKNKEEYMTELIAYHRAKILPQLIPADVLEGKRKLSRTDAKKFLFAMIDKEISIYAHMTLADEAMLLYSTDDFLPNLEKETAIARSFLSLLDGVRKDLNPGVLANLIKVFVLASQSRAELHSSAYSETMEVLADTILDQIFEEEI